MSAAAKSTAAGLENIATETEAAAGREHGREMGDFISEFGYQGRGNHCNIRLFRIIDAKYSRGSSAPRASVLTRQRLASMRIKLNPPSKESACSIINFGNATAELGNEKGQMWRTLGNDAASDIKTAGDVAVKYEDHQQISHGNATFAALTNDLTQKYNAALKNADPNDPSFVGKFNEEVVPALTR